MLELTQETAVSEEKALRERYFWHEHVTVIEPIRGWRSLDLREIWVYRELLFVLTMRDIKVRYKQTVLGAAWAILQPFMTMVVFTVFFGRLAGWVSEAAELGWKSSYTIPDVVRMMVQAELNEGRAA
jgi:hypothetical protein